MDELEKGIIPFVVGGLGNQMFIISAGYIAHKFSKCPLYLLQPIKKENKHNIKYRNYNNSIFKYFGTHLPFTSAATHFIQSLGYTEYVQHYESKINNIPYDQHDQRWRAEDIQPGTILHSSYFQFYPAIKPFQNELRDLYIRGLEEFSEKLKDYSQYSFLHIRRGDFLLEAHIPILSIEYYKNAVSILQGKGVHKYIIISNDIPWVKEQEYFKDPIFEVFDSDDELETMALMSKCTAGAICANSTFSWWGAFLGAYGFNKPVIITKEWVHGRDLVDLFPEEWIRI